MGVASDQDASAVEDALIVTVENAVVDAFADAQVIGVNTNVHRGRFSTPRAISWRARWRFSGGRLVVFYVKTLRSELSVIVPLYNEAAKIEAFLTALERTLSGCEADYEILLVDDGSDDGTWSVLCSLGSTHPRLRALRLSRNFGKDAALCAGIQEAQGELCLILDGDFEHPLELIPQMLETLRRSGANVVDAVKTRSPVERPVDGFLARSFYKLFAAVSGYDLDGHTDYKLFDRKVRKAWLEVQERSVFFRGVVAWLGFEHVSVHFTVPAVAGRSSRWTKPRLFALAVKSITSFSSAPLQLVTLLGFVNFLFAFLLGLQTFYFWLNGHAVEGFTTVILLQLIQGSVTMIALGLIGLYLARVSEEVKSRPRFLISERIDP